MQKKGLRIPRSFFLDDLFNLFNRYCRFSLYYYSNFEFKEGTAKETKLTVETSPAKGMVMREFDDDDNDENPPLELLIKTKYSKSITPIIKKIISNGFFKFFSRWEDCAINWNGVHPYI